MDPYHGILPNDNLYSGQDAAQFALIERRATAIVQQSYHSSDLNYGINLVTLRQNAPTSMVPTPAAALYAGNFVHTPNLATPTPYPPKSSVLSAFYTEALQRVQSALGGSP